MSGLIPIKLAEQAMANLEAELTDLKSTADRFEVENSILMKETARLMAEVEHLTSENLLVREEADRYCRLWQKAQVEVESLMTSPTSCLLRAERDENPLLKAELDRVTSQNGYAYTGLAVGMLREELAHKCHDNLEIRKAHQATIQMVRDLKAEVERLTKYGDVLESGLRTLPGDFPRCLANEWSAAKEGKQS